MNLEDKENLEKLSRIEITEHCRTGPTAELIVKRLVSVRFLEVSQS